MHARFHALRLLALLVLLAGCGGSGSSGFDPSILEGMLIEQAITEQRCVRDDGYDLPLCPSGAVVDEGGQGAPGPGGIRVTASLSGGSFVDCSPLAEEERCSLVLAIETEGLPAGATLRIAFRREPDAPWSVGGALEVQPANGSGAFMTPVTFELQDAGPAPQSLQIAVLVFALPPASVPAEVDVLSATGADYAFVLPPLPFTSPSSP